MSASLPQPDPSGDGGGSKASAVNSEATTAFVKFFGQSSNRSPRDRPVLDAVKTSGSHRICTYPRGRRPRAVRDGDVMFMGHLVSGPNDIKVYGRAVARAYEEGRDDAGPDDSHGGLGWSGGRTSSGSTEWSSWTGRWGTGSRSGS